MKKLNKIVLSNQKEVLVNRELKKLLGGYDGDIKNTNEDWGCKCTYNNRGNIDNTNNVNGCACQCV